MALFLSRHLNARKTDKDQINQQNIRNLYTEHPKMYAAISNLHQGGSNYMEIICSFLLVIRETIYKNNMKYISR